MLEGDTSVPSGDGGSGSDANVASGSTPDTSTGSGGVSPGGNGGTGSLSSAEGGSAPVLGADGVVGAPTPAEPAAVPAPLSKFRFAGREWDSQEQAENAWKAKLGRNWQGKVEAAERKLAEQETLVRALQSQLTGGAQPGQGTAAGQASSPEPRGFAEKLVKSGDLDFITGLLQDPDPQAGLQKFTVALADRMDREINERLEQVRTEQIEPIVRQREFERTMGSALGVARGLGSQFPELDNSNQSPEAVEHQQAFVETLQQFPRDFVATNPDLAMLATALLTRYQYGIPIVAQAPGTSGSPSARAALASEQAFAAQAGVPIEGTGTPRPRPNGQGETPLDRIRRENAAAPGNFHSPSGKDLGFGPA
jgi:hypothetical protein